MLTSPKFSDVVIYGGNSAGLTAAVQAARDGKSVVVIEPSHRVGGLTTGGLGDTDVGNKDTIGGLAREFYDRVGRKYGQGEPVWMFEPKVALEVYLDLVQEHGITVYYGERLDLKNGVEKMDGTITAIRMESGQRFAGKVFIDASYEGDLLAKAGVSYTIGREDNSQYDETLNGIRPENELPAGIDPYRIPGDPTSGLLARVNPNAGGPTGSGDRRIQAYNFRMVLTNDPTNRVDVEKPEGYLEEDYEILFRAIECGQTRRFYKFRDLPNAKSDSNNDSGISTDYIGMNYAYPEGDYATREEIHRAHERYQKGLVWTVRNHPRVPEDIRAYYRPWGLPKDEFVETGHWPSQLYIRESRRMVTDYTITEHVVVRRDTVEDSVGQGSYAMDSHHTQYCVNEHGHVRTEGGFYEIFDEPYPISYRALIPRRSECSNLLVPVCIAATHAAYGSARMEPVFMILGQSAALAASLAIDLGVSVQDVPYAALQKRLAATGQLVGRGRVAEAI